MVTVQNSDVRQEIVDVSGFQQISNALSIDDGKVIAVVDVNPKHARTTRMRKEVSYTTQSASANTMYTVPAGKELHITHACMTMQKDVTCDVTTGAWTMYALPYGEATAVAFIGTAFLTLTAQVRDVCMSFPIPIVLKAGSTVNLAAFPFTAGTASRHANFGGYLIEVH